MGPVVFDIDRLDAGPLRGAKYPWIVLSGSGCRTISGTVSVPAAASARHSKYPTTVWSPYIVVEVPPIVTAVLGAPLFHATVSPSSRLTVLTAFMFVQIKGTTTKEAVNGPTSAPPTPLPKVKSPPASGMKAGNTAPLPEAPPIDRKSTSLNSSHLG